jgi:hypothetical protein
MATYHQLTLFDLDTYTSECNTSDVNQVSSVEEFSAQVESEQLELNLFPKAPKRFFVKNLKLAA